MHCYLLYNEEPENVSETNNSTEVEEAVVNITSVSNLEAEEQFRKAKANLEALRRGGKEKKAKESK